jgi:hypothetical protein
LVAINAPKKAKPETISGVIRREANVWHLVEALPDRMDAVGHKHVPAETLLERIA